MIAAFIAATFFSWIAWQTPAPAPLPSPSPSASPAPTPSPAPSPSPAPLPTPSPSPIASPSPVPTPLPTPLVLPPQAPPQILAVQVSNPVLRGGETFTGTVITSTNVATVEVRLAGHAMHLERANPGVWQITHVVPQVPFWLRRRYTAQIVASNAAGAQTSQDITLTLR